MRKLWILSIFFIGILLSACVTYPVVGSFINYNEVVRGTVHNNLWTGTAYIEIEAQVTKVRCRGNSYVTYVPPYSFTTAGQRGKAQLTCDDGRVMEAEYVILSGTKGIGSGYDQQGNKLFFTFGMSEAEAQEYINKELKIAAARPDLPPPYKPKEVRKEKGFSTGTGFFISSNGYLVTNYHVIEDSKNILVVTNDNRELGAEIVKADPANDVVLLKVNAKTRALPISHQCNLSKGEDVFTLGYPLIMLQGQEQKATFGRVNSLSGVQGDIRFIQIDVPVQPGNSGGPLINMKGQVVGVVTATLNELVALQASGHLPQSVNYAVKSDYVVPLLRYSIEDKLTKQGVVGVKRPVTDLIKIAEPSVVFVIAK